MKSITKEINHNMVVIYCFVTNYPKTYLRQQMLAHSFCRSGIWKELSQMVLAHSLIQFQTAGARASSEDSTGRGSCSKFTHVVGGRSCFLAGCCQTLQLLSSPHRTTPLDALMSPKHDSWLPLEKMIQKRAISKVEGMVIYNLTLEVTVSNLPHAIGHTDRLQLNQLNT